MCPITSTLVVQGARTRCSEGILNFYIPDIDSVLQSTAKENKQVDRDIEDILTKELILNLMAGTSLKNVRIRATKGPDRKKLLEEHVASN